MAITFSGLASDLDTQSIISSLVKVEQIPLTRIQTQQAAYTQAKSSISTFLSKVAALRSAAATLATPDTYRSLTSSSSDSAVTATVSGAASPSSYSVDVIALAHEQRQRSNTFSSSTDALGNSGTLSIQVGTGTAVDVTVGASDSLVTIADNINKANAGVSASVLYDGAEYRLLVRGNSSGAKNAITFSESGLALGLDDPANTFQAATDAHVKIDGIDVTRSSNLIQGALPGVTLSLTKETSATATITIGNDPTALANKINTLVSAYNDMVGTAHATAGYGSTKASNPLLQGDTAIRSTLDRLARVLGSSVSGTSGLYTTLGSVGLSSTKEGTLQLDTAKLQKALTADPSAVARLFTTDTTTGATGAMGVLTSAIDKLTVGTTSLLTGRMNALDKQATKLGDDAEALQRRLDIYQANLQKQFTQLEMTMSDIKSRGTQLTSFFDSSSSSSSSSK